MNTTGYTIIIWKPEGLQTHYCRTEDDLHAYCVKIGLYNDAGDYQSDDKWLVFRGHMTDSSKTI